MARTYCVGLTGGIGSGKSAAAACFANLGVPVIDTDVISRELTVPGGRALPEIQAVFGAGMVNATEGMDRQAMRTRILADEKARRCLENILHPLIRAEALRRLALSEAPYTLLVVPLLAENWASYQAWVDTVLLVDCPVALQIERTAARPQMDEEQARAIIAAQISREARLQIADAVLNNQTDLATLCAQVDQLHTRYLEMAGRCPGA